MNNVIVTMPLPRRVIVLATVVAVFISIGNNISFRIGLQLDEVSLTPANDINDKDLELNDKDLKLNDKDLEFLAVRLNSIVTFTDSNRAIENNSNGNMQPSRDILSELDHLSGGYDFEDLKCPGSLVPFNNVINRGNSTAISDMLKIPKILHFSYKSRCLPRDIDRNLKRWQKMFPNYSIFFHDDAAVARLIEQEWSEFPDLNRTMNCVLFKGAMKIDIWRILILYKYGGVYSDIDNWPLDAMTETSIRSDLSAFFLHDPFNRPSQWFMAFEPNHPMMYLSMTQIIHNLLNMEDIHRPKVVFVTGPQAVSSAYHNFIAINCCNGTLTARELQKNDVVITGMFEKKLLKSSRKDLIKSKFGYEDIVPYNATMNVTRAKRIEMESGVMHWLKFKDRISFNLRGNIFLRSCRIYLDALEKGLTTKVMEH